MPDRSSSSEPLPRRRCRSGARRLALTLAAPLPPANSQHTGESDPTQTAAATTSPELTEHSPAPTRTTRSADDDARGRHVTFPASLLGTSGRDPNYPAAESNT